MDDTSELQLGQIATGRKLLLSTFILVRKSIWRDKRSYVMIVLLPGHFWLFIGYQNGSWSKLGLIYPKGKLLTDFVKWFYSFRMFTVTYLRTCLQRSIVMTCSVCRKRSLKRNHGLKTACNSPKLPNPSKSITCCATYDALLVLRFRCLLGDTVSEKKTGWIELYS